MSETTIDVQALERRCYHCYRILWGNNVASVVKKALEIISKVVANICKDPLLPKYRTLRRANKRVAEAIFVVPGARQLLQTLGFRYLREAPGAEEVDSRKAEQVLEDRILTLPIEDSEGLSAVQWFHSSGTCAAYMAEPSGLKPIKLRFGVKLNTFVKELVVLFAPQETIQDLYQLIDEYEGLKLQVNYCLLKLPGLEQVPRTWSLSLQDFLRSTMQVERLDQAGNIPERLPSKLDVGDERHNSEQRALAAAAAKKLERQVAEKERQKNLMNFQEDRERKNELEAFKTRQRLEAKRIQEQQAQDFQYANADIGAPQVKDGDLGDG